MYLKKIKLHNFRNYEKLSISLTKGINIIYGKNAQGKTNLLESIYVLGFTKSHRAFIDDSLIKINNDYLTIEGIINKDKIDSKFNIYIDKNKKVLKCNDNIVKKVNNYISLVNIIIFYPEDLELIKGSPKIRRKFLDLEISQLYSNYYVLINEYNKLLRMRNDYLKKLKSNLSKEFNYINILDDYIIDKSISIYKLRKKYVDRLNEYCEKIYENIIGLKDFNIKYIINSDYNIEDKDFKTKYTEEFKSKLEVDLRFCTTSVGPHKDELEFYLGNKNLKYYGSQGQQRVAVLSTKLSEIEILKKYKNDTPILLLDDVFSELDIKVQNNLLNYITKGVQTIITTTDLNKLENKLIKKSKLFNIEQGVVKKIKEVIINE